MKFENERSLFRRDTHFFIAMQFNDDQDPDVRGLDKTSDIVLVLSYKNDFLPGVKHNKNNDSKKDRQG